MMKEPQLGRVKTRLGQDIGAVDATWWFRHQTRRLLREMRDPRWQIALAVSPDIAAQTTRCLPADLPRWPQGRGDLGDRMRRMLTIAPKGRNCLIGADIPNVTRAHIARAFCRLGNHDAVFGPATDGGFWLVGLRQPIAPRTFSAVRWSTPHALSDTISTLPSSRVAFVDSLSDVDCGADLTL
jgi:rSAM/selenodomain-associated transferase 1